MDMENKMLKVRISLKNPSIHMDTLTKIDFKHDGTTFKTYRKADDDFPKNAFTNDATVTYEFVLHEIVGDTEIENDFTIIIVFEKNGRTKELSVLVQVEKELYGIELNSSMINFKCQAPAFWNDGKCYEYVELETAYLGGGSNTIEALFKSSENNYVEICKSECEKEPDCMAYWKNQEKCTYVKSTYGTEENIDGHKLYRKFNDFMEEDNKRIILDLPTLNTFNNNELEACISECNSNDECYAVYTNDSNCILKSAAYSTANEEAKTYMKKRIQK